MVYRGDDSLLRTSKFFLESTSFQVGLQGKQDKHHVGAHSF